MLRTCGCNMLSGANIVATECKHSCTGCLTCKPSPQPSRLQQRLACLLVAWHCRFNDIRNKKPHLAKYRWQNIGWYFYEAVATGWLWGAKPLSRKIARVRVSMQVTFNQSCMLDSYTYCMLDSYTYCMLDSYTYCMLDSYTYCMLDSYTYCMLDSYTYNMCDVTSMELHSFDIYLAARRHTASRLLI